MSRMLRQFRRAPGRIIASVVALALAVGAVGVLAIPTVSERSLHAAVDRDGLGDIVVATTPLDAGQVERVGALPGVRTAAGSVVVATAIAGPGTEVQLVGLATDRSTDLLRIAAGRAASRPDEVVASPGLATVGESLRVADRAVTVVGIGSTLWWSGSDVLYGELSDVAPLAPDGGTNRLTIVAEDDDKASLDRIATDVRAALAEQGDTFIDFPTLLPDGSTPIDADIRQVSGLIGLLGVMAGLVALVLLASTTTTLITERTREVAVMRALGGRQRALRRRLRRIALAIAAVALAIGLPLGVLISNLIARMVLEKFVGVTPGVAVDWRVLAGSSAATLLGARVVSARAARRVTALPLAAALRDRDGAPFGQRWFHCLAARLGAGAMTSRLATRASLRRPGRTVAVVAQIAASVGAAFLVPSLAASVNRYNEAAFAPWTWETSPEARDPGLPLAADLAVGHEGVETAVYVFGTIDGHDIDAWGLEPDSIMFAAPQQAGRWFRPDRREVVMSAGFAERRGISVGDDIDVELASGTVRYAVVGTVDDHSVTIYTDRDVLAADLGAPGHANIVLGRPDATVPEVPAAMKVWSRAGMQADSAAGRDAIVVIFGSIGAIVVGVAALSVLSSMLVSLFERRHELAALQALGARRGRLRRLLVRELVPLGVLGTGLGLALGALGTRGIIASFEASNSVDIGVVDAIGAIPFVVVGTIGALVLLALVVVRNAARRPIAVTLRGAA